MKHKILLTLLASSLLALAAWLVPGLAPAQRDDLPERYQETVHKGLEYLVKNQCKDGHWEGDGGQHPVAMTGLVGVALLMAKHVRPYRSGLPVVPTKYLANVRKAGDWLTARSQEGRDGLLFSDHPSETTRYMQGHGLATLFLAGALQQETDRERREKLTPVVTRAVQYILKAQSSRGGWYRTSRVEGHDLDEISATAIQVQALQAAENAGVPVPEEAISEAKEYLKKAVEQLERAAKSGKSNSRSAQMAAALACRTTPSHGLGQPIDELCEKWFKDCQAEIPVGRDIRLGRDELVQYYFAQAVFTHDEAAWKDYRTATFEQLHRRQNKDGSWPAGNDLGVGPVYSTAVWCIILQLDNISHPSRGADVLVPVK